MIHTFDENQSEKSEKLQQNQQVIKHVVEGITQAAQAMLSKSTFYFHFFCT